MAESKSCLHEGISRFDPISSNPYKSLVSSGFDEIEANHQTYSCKQLMLSAIPNPNAGISLLSLRNIDGFQLGIPI